MEISSLFLESELIIWREGCAVIDHGDHLSIRCASNPNWRWGNLVVLDHPPRHGDLARWLQLFASHFPEGRPHRMFVWDDPSGNEGEANDFIANGYRLQHDHVLAASELISPRAPTISVRFSELETDEEWEQVIVANAKAFGESIPNYELFVRGLLSIHRALAEKGKGFWLCAYVDGVLAGSCGIFTNGVVSRYQEVSVSPAFQTKGVASNMVYQAALLAQTRNYPMPLLMVADIDSQAERIYKRLGFEIVERTSSLRIVPEDKK